MGVLASGHHRTLSERVHTVIGLAKSHVVLIVAVIAAAVTCVFVPPDAGYADYFDLDTLSCLFCTLAVVSALKERRFFEWMAGKIVTAFGNMRRVVFALVFVTYFGSMIMANDMALVTFLPLGYYALSSCGRREHTAFVFVMQNVAANLGGMLTPFGNPQNLYLYSYYAIPAGEFFTIMALPFAAAFVLIAVTCLFVRPVPVKLETPEVPAPPAWRVAVYFVLFALSVLIVFRVFPFMSRSSRSRSPCSSWNRDRCSGWTTRCSSHSVPSSCSRETSRASLPSGAPSVRWWLSRRCSHPPPPARS